ncbi:MAG: diguanylate cyclase [Planctomycetes bacterium]|nr:diguanylate cyclase [Planctomycetota bacterium]
MAVPLTWMRSVVLRLIAGLVIGGLLLSVGLWFMERRSAEAVLQLEVTQRTVMTARNLQSVLHGLIGKGANHPIHEAMAIFTAETYIRGARLSVDGMPAVETGEWDETKSGHINRWTLAEHGMARGNEIDIDRLTQVRAPFKTASGYAMLDLLVDGPALRGQLNSRLRGQLSAQWLVLGVMTLLGLLFLRRWVMKPLSGVMGLVRAHAGPEPFYRMSREHGDEFGQLAEAIGGMLTRLECTADQLGKRERAFQNLYRFAPAAMLSMDRLGKVLEANPRAAELLGEADEKKLIGRPVLDFILAEDRTRLRQTIDRLDLDHLARCELRVAVGESGRSIDVMVECSGLRDQDGILQSVQLSLVDISESKVLQRQVADKSQLLNLVIDHMSDAIVLVDADGRVAAHNQQLSSILHCRPNGRVGLGYDVEHFWDELGVIKRDLFIARLRQIDAERERPAQERFETRAGTFLFQGIPVHDTGGHIVGRLWVVQEVTPQEQIQRLLNQQTRQLQALKKLTHELGGLSGLQQVVQGACEQVFDVFGVEAVGVALRYPGETQRSLQVIHRGPGTMLLETHRALIEAIETQLMPQVLGNVDVALWPEMPRTLPWAKAFTQAGLTSLAAGPLRGCADAQGILWIARRGGERMERHHIYLLEALAPIIAARIEVAQLREEMHAIEHADPATNLPTTGHWQRQADRLAHRPGYPWAAVVIKLDHFRRLNDLMDHDAADGLLARIATRLQDSNRKNCVVARLAGASFGVLSPGSSREQAVALAQRLSKMIAQESVTLADGSAWPLTASIGVACSPDDGTTAAGLLELALARTEAAKRAGRDQVVAEGTGAERLAG